MVARFVQTLVTLKPLQVCFVINIWSSNHAVVPNDEKFLSQNWIFSVVKRNYTDAGELNIVDLMLKIRVLPCKHWLLDSSLVPLLGSTLNFFKFCLIPYPTRHYKEKTDYISA